MRKNRHRFSVSPSPLSRTPDGKSNINRQSVRHTHRQAHRVDRPTVKQTETKIERHREGEMGGGEGGTGREREGEREEAERGEGGRERQGRRGS